MLDQYSPIPASREVRELRRELQAAHEEIDRLHDQIRDLESDLCLAQPRSPRRNTAAEYIADRLAQMPGASDEEVSAAIGVGIKSIVAVRLEVAAMRQQGEEAR